MGDGQPLPLGREAEAAGGRGHLEAALLPGVALPGIERHLPACSPGDRAARMQGQSVDPGALGGRDRPAFSPPRKGLDDAPVVASGHQPLAIGGADEDPGLGMGLDAAGLALRRQQDRSVRQGEGGGPAKPGGGDHMGAGLERRDLLG